MVEKAKKQAIVKERKLEKEILGVLAFLAVLVIVFIIATTYFKSLNYFEYEGLTFSKERFGEIPLYHHTYYLRTQDGKILQYNFYLRNDPRENDVLLEGAPSNLLSSGAVAYLSINSDGLQECRQSQLAVASISSFMADNQMKVVAGNLDFWDAGSKRDQWITCETKPGNRVVELLKGNETKVTISGNCYRIEVADCEILEAVEKLEVQSVLDAKRKSLS